MNELIQKFYQKYQNIDLFVWDFDETITKRDTEHNSYNTSIKRDVILRRVADPILFYNLVIFLLGKGKKVAIASWNDPRFFTNRFGGVPLIHFFMDNLFYNKNTNAKQQIFTEHNIISYWPGLLNDGKNTHLQKLSKRFNVQKNKIILFDDNFGNIQKALSNGYNVHYVPADVNFTRRHLINILG